MSIEEAKKQGIESLFVPYEIALALKKLGFDEPCFKCKLIGQEHLDYTPTDYDDFPEQKEKEVLIPTFSQAFRWFREKYGDYLLYSFGVIPHFTIIQNLIIEDSKITYEEAELECLKKLIEIVNGKKI